MKETMLIRVTRSLSVEELMRAIGIKGTLQSLVMLRESEAPADSRVRIEYTPDVVPGD